MRLQPMTNRFSLLRLLSLVLFMTLPLATVFAQHIIATIPVGEEPRGVGVIPGTGDVYVANVHSGTISVLRNNAVITTLPVDTLPFVIAANPRTNRIYAAGCNFLTGAGSMVVVIDGHTNQVIDTIALNQACGLGTQGIALNSFNNRVYVSDYDDNQEVVIDGATNKIVARVDLAGKSPLGVAVDLFTNQVWVALDGPTGTVDIIDGATNTVTGTLTLGSIFVESVAINPLTRRVYITSASTPSTMYVINARTHAVITTVP
ncbi:MAG TPA: YncE family protein, partial [Candidatus Sulfotelmatobacter sp.]